MTTHARSPESTPEPTPADVLREEQRATLAEAPRRPGFLARALFATMDLVYGKTMTLEHFLVLELVALVPYQAWESVGYVAITHTASAPRFARRVFEYVREARESQDNEQWHLLILEELIVRRGDGWPRHLRWLLAGLVPQLLALFYYHVSWLLYVVAPALSYGLNADFEDHAEHVYMAYVAAHPELDAELWKSDFVRDYGAYATVGDVLRRIALDERDHKLASLARLPGARFTREELPA